MSIFSLLSLSIVIFLVAASPGPGVFATVATSIYSGFRTALMLVAGIVAGHLFFLLVAVLGLSLVAVTMGDLLNWVKRLGGVYLIGVGISIGFFNADRPAWKSERNASSYTEYGFRGVLVTMSNPKAIIFYLGILPTWISLSTLTITDAIIVSTLIAGIFFLVLTAYAYVGAFSRKVFAGSRGSRYWNNAAGGMMIAAGAFIAARS